MRELLVLLGVVERAKKKIIVLGLDNAGKTSLVYSLMRAQFRTCIPTLHSSIHEVTFEKTRWSIYDLCDHHGRTRWLHREHARSMDGMIFFVDGADKARFAEAREELSDFLHEPAYANIPIAVLGNKIDLPEAASEDELRSALGMSTCDIVINCQEAGSSWGRQLVCTTMGGRCIGVFNAPFGQQLFGDWVATHIIEAIPEGTGRLRLVNLTTGSIFWTQQIRRAPTSGSSPVQPAELFMVSIWDQIGCAQAMHWLAGVMAQRSDPRRSQNS